MPLYLAAPTLAAAPVAAARLGYRLASPPYPAPWAACCLVGFLETIVSKRPRIPTMPTFTISHPPILQKVGIVGIVGI